jgi:hypothetical protein
MRLFQHGVTIIQQFLINIGLRLGAFARAARRAAFSAGQSRKPLAILTRLPGRSATTSRQAAGTAAVTALPGLSRLCCGQAAGDRCIDENAAVEVGWSAHRSVILRRKSESTKDSLAPVLSCIANAQARVVTADQNADRRPRMRIPACANA